MNIAHPTPVDIAQGIRRLSRTMGGLAHFSARRNAVDRYQGIGIRADVEAMFDPSLLKQITVDTLPVAGKVMDLKIACSFALCPRSSLANSSKTWRIHDFPVWRPSLV